MPELTTEEMARELKDNKSIPCPVDSSRCFGPLENCTQCFIDNFTPAEIRAKYAEMEATNE